MPSIADHIKWLTRVLYPRGRAFKIPIGGILDRLDGALALSEARAYTDALSILDSAIADNANFTTADATAWEARLGIIASSGTSLADRKKAINQKLNYPGTNAPRQHYLYIQSELQAAGFNVNVFENNFSGATKTAEQALGTTAGTSVYAATTQYKGTLQYGSTYNNKIANYIEEEKDAAFAIGSNYRSTFFVAQFVNSGVLTPVTSFADVPLARKDEFRQLLLMLKPAQTVGILFVNYV